MINLLVRRFIGPARECDRRTFVEQVDGLTERFRPAHGVAAPDVGEDRLVLAGRLTEWLARAEATGLPSLASLARGLRQDFAAVAADLTMERKCGRVQGNVNRVKQIKRDGYGRAGFDLLRLQLLHTH